jgi:DinB superfamily
LVNAQLEQYRNEFESIIEDAAQLVKGLTEEEFNWRPAAGAWSIEECLAHLTMVGTIEADLVERAIEQGRSNGLTGSRKFELSAIERLILRETEPPNRHSMRAPKRFEPVHNQPPTGIMPTFMHVQRRFLLLIERADGLDLRRVKVPTPITRFLRLSLGATFAQVAAHERRHLAQARRVLEKLPKGVPLPATH